MNQISPYFFFEGNCREAMTFYKNVFGGDLSVMLVGESPVAGSMPEDMKDRVLHAALTIEGKLMIMASDTMEEGQKSDMGEGVYNCIDCKDSDEIQKLFKKLSDGGTVTSPLKEEFFGMFGNLTDKFGVKWMLVANKPQE